MPTTFITKHVRLQCVRWASRMLLWAGMLAGPLQAQTVEYIHTDALGTPIAVTNATGAVLETSEYSPYGQLINRAANDEPGYTGHVLDAATGLIYMQQRYYDPQLGVLLSVDPVTAYEKPITNFNRYVYARNNPYKFTDPDGRDVTCNGTTCNIRCQGAECVGDFAKYGMIRMLSDAADVARILFPIIQQSQGDSPPLPGELVGIDDGKGGQQGGRINNGPLSPENGGTGDAEGDFGRLTGGNSSPAPEGSRLPEGSRVGENGVIYRPPSGSSGPRIDIPANGDKPHETLHYPPPPPPPEDKLQ